MHANLADFGEVAQLVNAPNPILKLLTSLTAYELNGGWEMC